MDPVTALGLVASILQLIAAANSVKDLGRNAANAPKEQRDLFREVHNLEPLLVEIQERLQLPGSQSINGLQPLKDPLLDFKETMNRITERLRCANESGSKFPKALSWTLWKKDEAEADLAKIERFKALLNTWLGLDIWDRQQKQHEELLHIFTDIGNMQRLDHYRLLTEVKNLAQNEQDFHDWASLLDIRDGQQRSHDQITKTSKAQRQDNYRILTEVRNVAQDQREFMDSVEREKIIEWLSPLNFFARQADIFGTRQEGTGKWLLEDPRFRAWLFGSGETIWCFGIPGAGKTVLASIVVEYLRNKLQSDTVGVVAAYLNHKESELQSPSNVLAGLWWQLVLDRPISASVQKLYQKLQKQRTRPSLDEVCDIFRAAVLEYSKVFIVIDALDEYSESRRPILLDTLAAIGGRVSLMFTSRPHIAPESFFPTAQVLEIRAKEEDIRCYVEAQIRNSSRLSKHVKVRPELRGEIESKILSNVEGMFLLAKLHMDSLATKNTVKAVRDALTSLPEDLEHTYSDAMDRIESQNKDDREIARRALIWVANAKRPLSIHELQEALSIELDTTSLDSDSLLDIEFIISVCAGLLIVDHAVRLVHHTTQDYIDRVQPIQFPCAQMEITSICLTYMSFNDFCVDRSQENWSFYHKYKLLSYASHHCLVHAAGEPELLLQESIIKFLSNAHRWRSPFLGGRVPSQWHYPHWPSVSSKLWVAAIFGLQEITKHLLEFDQFISKEEKESALIVASSENCPDIVRLLIKHGINVNATGGSYGNALHAAAAMGHVPVVQELIANGIDVNIQGTRYSSALNAALEGRHEGVAQLLIENGANVNVRGGLYRTVLQAESVKGNDKMVQLLLAKGANVNTQGGYYGGALQAASAKGRIAVVHLLLDKGANVNAQGGHYDSALQAALKEGHNTVAQLLIEKGADTRSSLHAASAMGDTTMVQLLIEKGADVNFQGGEYGTPLLAALMKGHKCAIRLLSEKGADVNFQGGYYGNALQVASWGMGRGVVQLLLQHGANVNAKGGFFGTALQAAAAKGNLNVVQVLLKHRANVNLQGGKCGTALQAASGKGDKAVVQLLLEHGADVNANGGHYGTALQAASAKGGISVAQLLLKHGADVNANGRHHRTALQAASAKGDKAVVQLLLEHGANVNANDGTALQAASAKGNLNVVQLLLEHGANVNLEGGLYRTALQAASAKGSLDVVQLLLDHGAAVNVQGGKFGTPLQAASRTGNMELVQLLFEKGADVNLHGGHYGTALKAAWQKGRTSVVRFLLQNGADIPRGRDGSVASQKRNDGYLADRE
ncbi:ankyrin repeat-containing domain protein [Mycena rebaudengoi]|nr:ankyrin repeat-containing domain protein [Mycena rebaudengoi]